MVTTIVWALPLGYWLTSQHVVRRQVLGAGVVVVGLAMFVLVGDPDAGIDDASAMGLVSSAVVISAVVVALMLWLRTEPLRQGERPSSACARACCSGWPPRSPSR